MSRDSRLGNNEVIKIAHGLQENSWTISLTIHMMMVSLIDTVITLTSVVYVDMMVQPHCG